MAKNNNFTQKMSELKDIVSNFSISDDAEIDQETMIDADIFGDSYNLALLFEETKDDNRDTEVTSARPSVSTVNDSSTSIGGTSQGACLEEVKGDSKKEAEELHLEKSKALKALADNAFNAQEFEKALKLLNKAIALQPNDSSLYTDRASTYLELCRYRKAIKECEVVLQFSEYCLKPWLYMAKSYFMLGEEALSKECIKEAIARNPEDLWDIESYEEEFRLIAEYS